MKNLLIVAALIGSFYCWQNDDGRWTCAESWMADIPLELWPVEPAPVCVAFCNADGSDA